MQVDHIQLAEMAKVLSHPARVKILFILLELQKEDRCLNSDLVKELGLAQSTVSEHVRILKDAGFISVEAIPPKACYRIIPNKIEELKERFSVFF